MWKNRVVWSEGLFLRPHHFQQQERFLETAIDQRAKSSGRFGWGFTSIEVDSSALAQGYIQINKASGVLPDGTTFHLPEQDAPPAPMIFPIEGKDQLCFLALALNRQGVSNTSLDSNPHANALMRFSASVAEFNDNNDGYGESAQLQIARLNLSVIRDVDLTGAFSAMGLVKVIEKKIDGQIIVDSAYIPASLSVNDNPAMRSFVAEVLGLLRQRSEAIAARMGQTGKGGISEIAEFLLLQLINRSRMLFEHYTVLANLHPEELYIALIQLVGELATFGSEKRIPSLVANYDHNDLTNSFKAVMTALRFALSNPLEQTAVKIDLTDKNYGVWLGIVNDKSLLKTCSFVLAVQAQTSGEMVRSGFPSKVKIGSPERIRELVNFQLPGITVSALPVAPRQIPFHAGYSYFQLDTNQSLWKETYASGGICIHVPSDEFPGIQLEFWAIKA